MKSFAASPLEDLRNNRAVLIGRVIAVSKGGMAALLYPLSEFKLADDETNPAPRSASSIAVLIARVPAPQRQRKPARRYGSRYLRVVCTMRRSNGASVCPFHSNMRLPRSINVASASASFP